jgi:hypothetical protein
MACQCGLESDAVALLMITDLEVQCKLRAPQAFLQNVLVTQHFVHAAVPLLPPPCAGAAAAAVWRC